MSGQAADCATWQECAVTDRDEESDNSGVIIKELIITSVKS